MELLAKEVEGNSLYKMNAQIVSDTEEWHKRKKSTTAKDEQQTSRLFFIRYFIKKY